MAKRTDKERLDWLQRNKFGVLPKLSNTIPACVVDGNGVVIKSGDTMRSAINAAMDATRPPKKGK